MTRSLAVLRQHRERETLRGPDGKHSDLVLNDLAAAGYWGLLVDRDYGGGGGELRHFLPFLTQAAAIDQPLAGLAAVHGCIGAVNPLEAFGSETQKRRYLPALASGQKLSAFASTEPGAGSDLRAVKTRAVRTQDGWEITGQKAFITNLAPGRTIGLLCKVDEQLAVFVIDLPNRENEHFELVSNPLHPLQHTINQGMKLRSLPIPADAILRSPEGKDGRAIVYHGLNRGRAAIAALAAGHLRTLLAGMVAWANERQMQGRKLAELQLIQYRCAHVAALIAACDALAQWCGALLDMGQRGEIECLIAKVFASEALKHAAFSLALPTHGGRFFLQGHPAGDLAYDYLAPCIYEGENDLLRLALFHALTKDDAPPETPPPAASGDRLTELWHDVGRNFRALLAQPKLHHSEMIAAAHQVEALTVCEVVRQWQRTATPTEQLAAQLVFQQQLKRALVPGGPWLQPEAARELELGQALLSSENPAFRDAPAFRDPLQNRR